MRSGLKQIFDKKNAFANGLGIELLAYDKGYAKGKMDVTRAHLNPIHSVHGGCIYSLSDSIAGFASFTYGYMTPTLSGEMKFLSPAIDIKTLYAEAREVKHGKHVSVYEVKTTSETGVLLAIASFSYFNTGIQLEDVWEASEGEETV